MPYNGAGTYAAPASTWNPAVTNTSINSTDWTALLADLTTALSTCLLKDGQQTPTANIPMGGFKFTGLAAGSATGNSLRYEQVFKTGQVALLGGLDTAGPVNETKTTVASATTPDIWTSVGNVVDYTGTVTATGFAAAPQAGARRTLVCAAAAPFTAGANMLIDGVASGSTYTAIAGDRINVIAVTTTQFRLTTPHTPFVDSYPIVQGSADATKQLRFALGGLTTGALRVITMPDVDITLAGQDNSQTLTNKTLTSPVLNTGVSGTALAAQSDMEAPASTSLIVTPLRVGQHPGVVKVFVRVAFPAGTPTSQGSTNLSSLTDNGTGDTTINFATAFSASGIYASAATQESDGAPATGGGAATKNAGNERVLTRTTAFAAIDAAFCYVAIGDQ